MLKSEGLSGILSSIEVDESIVAVSADPHSYDWHVLEEPDILAHLLKRAIEKLHKVHVTEVEGDISDIELPLRLIVVSERLCRVELFVILEDLLSRHLGLHLLGRLV